MRSTHRASCQFSEHLRRTFPAKYFPWRARGLRCTAPGRERSEYYTITMGHVRRLVWSVNQSSGESSACKKEERKVHVTRQPCCDFSVRGAMCGAARRRGVHYFQHRFCAFRPLTHSTADTHAYTYTYTYARIPLHPVDCPAALLFPVERVRRRAFFEYSSSLSLSLLSLFLFFSLPSCPFFALSSLAMTESIGSRYNFLDVTRLLARAESIFREKRVSRE